MAVNRIEPGSNGGLAADEPAHRRVIALADRRLAVAERVPAAGLQTGVSAEIHYFGAHFTSADLSILAAWALDTRHGYDRLHLERGSLEDGTWTSYALAYVPGQAWSTWGVIRRGDHVEVWRCATGRTVSRHARMAEALAALPLAADHRRSLPIAGDQDGIRVGARRCEPY